MTRILNLKLEKNILFLFLFFLFVSGQEIVTEKSAVKLCVYCTCSEIPDEDGIQVVLNVQCSELDKINSLTDLDNIEWPDNPNGLKIIASFEGLGLYTLAKLPPNSQVETLRFNNNVLKIYWPDPFKDLPNLKHLSFSQNDLSNLTPDLFTNIQKLEDLDFSYNKLTNFSLLDSNSLPNVKRLNFQSNNFRKIPVKALQALKALEELDLSKNGIYELVLEKEMNESLKHIKRLNLSGNKIRSLMKDTFPENNSLEMLDLSNNLIEIIEETAFVPCANLRELNLGQNKIAFNFALPPSLQIIILKQNTLYRWPKFPDGITYIDVSFNKLVDLYDEETTNFDNLEVFNIAGNQITEFNIQKKLPRLVSLDLSYNNLVEVPSSLNSQTLLSLEELRLDGNLFKTIYFKNILAVRSLYMSELNFLEVVGDKAFSNVVGRGVDKEDCFSLSLSKCEKLREIEEGAFDGTSLCMLDISHNNLTHLSQNLLDWSLVRDGVDLQWNPWDCSCHLQWVLQVLLPDMYRKHSRLLAQLRCQTPRGVSGLRLVHWYNWTDPILCRGDVTRDNYMIQPSKENNTRMPQVTSLTLILGAAIILGIFIVIGLMVYLIKTRRQYRVRQAALKRKRQSALDAKNGQNEQYSALNKA